MGGSRLILSISDCSKNRSVGDPSPHSFSVLRSIPQNAICVMLRIVRASYAGSGELAPPRCRVLMISRVPSSLEGLGRRALSKAMLPPESAQLPHCRSN